MLRLFARKNLFILILAIIAIGAFLRFYHFSDWLHFELDQSRDAKIIDLAIKDGPGNLPLLGPKAAGSFLRLGPAFYYFNYLSALVFGNTPSGIAMIIMLFGILAVPAFYLLVRRYFNKWISISLLLIFSTSLFLVMYSRFSWNPNPLPLFAILTVYSLLRAVDNGERKKERWLLLAAFSLSVATQLHFLAFVSFPIIAVIFFFIKRPKIKLKYWLGAAGIILVMNLPIIINEIKTGGDNFKEFMDVVSGKSNKDSDKSLLEKVVRNYEEHSMGYFLVLSAQNSELPKFVKNPKIDIQCDQSCRDQLPLGTVGLVIISGGLLLLIKNLLFERDAERKDFLVIITLWFLVSFALFIPLSYDISPRFWLVSNALPFVFLGFILAFFKKYLPKKLAIFLIILITAAFTISNLYETYKRFDQLKKAPYELVKFSSDKILKERHRVTLEQQYIITDYMEGFYKENKYPVYLNSDPFYRRAFLYHLEARGIPRDDFRNASLNSKVYQNGNYFLIYPTDSNLDDELNDYSNAYDIVSRKEFGTLAVFRLTPKPEAINAIQQRFGPEGKPTSAPGVPVRCRWNEIFGRCNTSGLEDDDDN